MRFARRPPTLIDPADALPGRSEPLAVAGTHEVTGNPLTAPWPEGHETLVVGMGCFWGAERLFWQTDGVWTSAVGYAGGFTPNPTYEEVCSGRTGHAEVVLVVFDPTVIGLADLLRTFWEGHDPTQGMRQGNDVGTQYRSCVYWADDNQRELIESTLAAYEAALQQAGRAEITTEIGAAPIFFYAEGYHQQYLAKVPSGYCGIGGTGVACPTPGAEAS